MKVRLIGRVSPGVMEDPFLIRNQSSLARVCLLTKTGISDKR